MRTLTPEIKKLLDETTKYTPIRQLILFVVWDVFCPKRRDIVIKSLQLGKSWRFAFEDGKQKNMTWLNL